MSAAAHAFAEPAGDMPPFEADIGGVRVVFGPGSLARLGELAAALGRRPLLVTDPGVSAAGHAGRALAALAAPGLAAALFATVREDPDEGLVEEVRDAARAHGADLLVGLGGGSAMDAAKGACFLLAGGGRMRDYRGAGRMPAAMLPAIGIPTTAGTGSEAQSFALISEAETHRKMACGDPAARFRIAVLDPELIASAPRPVLARSALDAFAHAIESYVCTRRNPVSAMLGRAAFAHLERGFHAALVPPAPAAALAHLLLGAHLAGAAIEASMLGAAHALANPLSERHGAAHGVAVGMMLPHVVRYNAVVAGSRYAELVAASPAPPTGIPAGEALARRVESYLAEGGMPGRLREIGVDEAELPALAAEAAGQWTARFNPRAVTAETLLDLYRAAY